MNLIPLLNRDGSLPTDGWYHLVPLGEYPHAETGLVQVIDGPAIDGMLNRFNQEAASPTFAGKLVDQDHFSYDTDKPSESFGWVKKMDKRPDGLWGQIDFSDIGEAAVKNRRYKFVSPVFWPADTIEKLGGNKVRPTRIDSFGLTNNPNFKGMTPFTNRAGTDVSAEAQTKTPSQKMKTVAQRLGLSADASEDSILSALDKLTNRATGAETERDSLKTEVTELRNRNKSLIDEQIASDLDAAGITDESKRSKLTPVLVGLKNRQERVDFLKDCVKSDAAPGKEKTGSPVLNRAESRTPANRQDRQDDKPKHEDPVIARRISNRAVQIQKERRCSFGQAFDLAKGEFISPASN